MRKSASRPDQENPEWTAEEVRRAKPLIDMLPRETVEAVRRYRGQRGPQRNPTKELISLRVDRDVVAAYRATGVGWQKRASEALRVYAAKGRLPGRASVNRRETLRRAKNRHHRTASRK